MSSRVPACCCRITGDATVLLANVYEASVVEEMLVSIGALNWALNVETGNHTNKLVLLLLADRHNEVEDSAWPAVGWLAEHGEMSRRTAQRALRDLEHRGLIIPVGWAGKQADRMTKRYRLPFHETGRQNDTGRHVVQTGRHVVQTGRHPDALTIREPLENRASRTRRKRRPVDNLSRPVIPTLEETLRMLEEERTTKSESANPLMEVPE
jgi:DNA-binding transcriptional ArsR family regulator